VEGEDSIYEADILNNLGGLYSLRGDPLTALDYNEQALTIANRLNNTNIQLDSLGLIGEIYVDLGRYDEALDYTEQSLAIASNIND
jgi:tetratricopeptide (TPR) repeat protein